MTAGSLRTKNADALGGRLTGSLPEFRPGAAGIEILRSKTGLLTAKIDNILLHSLYDPAREAEKFVAGLDISNGDSVLVIGLAFGYHLPGILAKTGPAGTVVVLEPNRQILAAALESVDMTHALGAPNLRIVTGQSQEEIAPAISAFLREKPAGRRGRVAIHPASYRLIPPGFDAIKNAVEFIRMEGRFRGAMGSAEEYNVVKNIPAVMESPGAGIYFGRKLEGCAGVLAGAGPSLDRAMRDISILAKRGALIVAVDAALDPLADAGIEPHFVFTADPQPAVRRFFAKTHGGARLIFLPTANSGAVKTYKGEKRVLISAGNPVTAPAEKMLAFKGLSFSGGSVSCIGLEFLIQSGANPIFIAGQDFGFTGGRIYARESFDSRFASSTSTTLAGEAEWQSAYASASETVNLGGAEPAAGNKAINTHRNLMSYQRDFETAIAANPGIDFYNLDSAGAAISGAERLKSTAERAGNLTGRKFAANSIRLAESATPLNPTGPTREELIAALGLTRAGDGL